MLDMNILEQDFPELLAYEKQIFKEYQFVDWLIYKENRLKFLKEQQKNSRYHNLDVLIQYLECYIPNIGFFAGSFNPFHKGHWNILGKSEQIFDKVIVAFGDNPEKNNEHWDIPEALDFRQKLFYNGLMTDAINNLGYPVTVIRGLRNDKDLAYEINQYRFLKDLKPDIKVINILCDIEYEHISSSAIRSLKKFNAHEKYLLK
jgi:pantetheine-phosphate adenylyltransferase